jgi:hypothetical protein
MENRFLTSFGMTGLRNYYSEVEGCGLCPQPSTSFSFKMNFVILSEVRNLNGTYILII